MGVPHISHIYRWDLNKDHPLWRTPYGNAPYRPRPSRAPARRPSSQWALPSTRSTSGVDPGSGIPDDSLSLEDMELIAYPFQSSYGYILFYIVLKILGRKTTGTSKRVILSYCVICLSFRCHIFVRFVILDLCCRFIVILVYVGVFSLSFCCHVFAMLRYKIR